MIFPFLGHIGSHHLLPSLALFFGSYILWLIVELAQTEADPNKTEIGRERGNSITNSQ